MLPKYNRADVFLQRVSVRKLRDSLLCIFRQDLLKNKHLCNQELNGSDRLQERMSPWSVWSTRAAFHERPDLGRRLFCATWPSWECFFGIRKRMIGTGQRILAIVTRVAHFGWWEFMNTLIPLMPSVYQRLHVEDNIFKIKNIVFYFSRKVNQCTVAVHCRIVPRINNA